MQCASNVVKILSVSPQEEDYRYLQSIADPSAWLLLQADGVTAARSLLRQHDVSVVLCERDLAPGSWIDLLDTIRLIPHSPSLIVTSRMADERLWAEALNLGAWDVLAKPFDRVEVLRTVAVAWQHRQDGQRASRAAMKAAS